MQKTFLLKILNFKILNKLNKLSGQELTKQQMNQVTGGYSCRVTTEDGRIYSVNVDHYHIAGATVRAAIAVERHSGSRAVNTNCS